MLRFFVGLSLIVLPLLELMLLVKAGQLIGVWATVGLVVAAAVAGALIISHQSSAVLRRTLEALSEGHAPVGPVLDGLFLLVAGVLLLMPGLVSDVLALALLVPPIRRAVAGWSMRLLLKRVDVADDDAPRHPRSGSRDDGPVIEGEFERLSETPVDPNSNGQRQPG